MTALTNILFITVFGYCLAKMAVYLLLQTLHALFRFRIGRFIGGLFKICVFFVFALVSVGFGGYLLDWLADIVPYGIDNVVKALLAAFVVRYEVRTCGGLKTGEWALGKDDFAWFGFCPPLTEEELHAFDVTPNPDPDVVYRQILNRDLVSDKDRNPDEIRKDMGSYAKYYGKAYVPDKYI